MSLETMLSALTSNEKLAAMDILWSCIVDVTVRWRFTAGDEYTYECEKCRTVWRTGMRPGSDV